MDASVALARDLCLSSNAAARGKQAKTLRRLANTQAYCGLLFLGPKPSYLAYQHTSPESLTLQNGVALVHIGTDDILAFIRYC